MKKLLILLAVFLVFAMACSDKDDSGAKQMKVGMVTDAGTIDDKSFNQGTWEGY